MCDVSPHDTGWIVVKVQRSSEWSRLHGRTVQITYRWLRCRTAKCIESRVDKVGGHWNLSDFNTVYDV